MERQTLGSRNAWASLMELDKILLEEMNKKLTVSQRRMAPVLFHRLVMLRLGFSLLFWTSPHARQLPRALHDPAVSLYLYLLQVLQQKQV